MDHKDGQSRQTPPCVAKLSTGFFFAPLARHAFAASLANKYPLESWVEVSSQPSSSSLSSIGDEIVTTGLRVGNAYSRRQRPTSQSARCLVQPHPVGSSSDEYDESESEEDGVLSNSGENLDQHQPRRPDNVSDESDDDGDNATALGGAAVCPVFRPQPNAFSHPPSRQSHSAGNVMPPHPHSGFTRPPFTQRSHMRTRRVGPSLMASPSSREVNDAALRASLTTLLSCAAAARAIPRSKENEAPPRRADNTGLGPSNEPMHLRLVPESELAAPSALDQAPPCSLASRPPVVPSRSSSRASGTRAAKPKRNVSGGRSPRATKKKRTASAASEDSLVSPTLLTWVVSAGVVVLVSVVGFGAGYVIGREVGHQEALSASVSGVKETTHCGREVIGSSGGGLRRLRWGAVGRGLVAQVS
ncbi:hypothetical protein CDD82_5470 [Ophiocordyceps australis]|uniref:Uncharacterized protein n=1 Tax=Ophiocordyceps australis TaxID=1399860 RepID=A0A2C5Y5T6_9HYPO|nr:hypothetical protein CDD82_5470 [Ophiocordyceps australis]